MEPWLQAMLVDKGVMSESGLTTTARIRLHPPCRIPTLAGLDGPRCALDTWCDLAELNALGEAEAHLAGRRTYWLHGRQLVPRDQWSIPAKPAGAPGSPPVLVEHRCHELIPSHWIHHNPTPQQPSTPAVTTDLEGNPF